MLFNEYGNSEVLNRLNDKLRDNLLQVLVGNKYSVLELRAMQQYIQEHIGGVFAERILNEQHRLCKEKGTY